VPGSPADFRHRPAARPVRIRPVLDPRHRRGWPAAAAFARADHHQRVGVAMAVLRAARSAPPPAGRLRMRSRTSIKDEWREVRLFQNRVMLAVVLMFLLLLGLVMRLYWLQVERHPHYATLSEGNRVRIQTLAPNRGLIYDRNGILLAENVPNYQLELVPEQVQDIDETLQRLAEIIHLRPADIEQFEKLRRTKRRFEPVPLRYNLSDEEVARFAVHRQDFPGV